MVLIIDETILGSANGQVTVQSRAANGGSATLPYHLTDIKSVSMAVPAVVT